MAVRLELSLTPGFALRCGLGAAGGAELADELAAGLAEAFARGAGFGLVRLAGALPSAPLAPAEAYWRDLAKMALTHELSTGATAPPADWSRQQAAAPLMAGGEYLEPAALSSLWVATLAAAAELRLEAGGATLAQLLTGLDRSWDAACRVCLSLAENRADPARPFAMIATYTTQPGGEAKPRHAPLARALQERAAQGPQLARITAVLRAAAERSALVREWLESRRIFQPQALGVGEAHRFLRDAPLMEAAGLMVRVPDWWTPASPPRPRVTVTVGEAPPAGAGLGAMLSFRAEVALFGTPLAKAEWEALQAAASGLLFLRGQWVEVDAERIQQALTAWESSAALAERQGLSFAQAMRLLVGGWPGAAAPAALGAPAGDQTRAWSDVVAGPWLKEAAAALQRPDAARPPALGPGFRATLRPYQQTGLAWLWRLHLLGLGGCLADDMGLGKTLQVLAYFAALKVDGAPRRRHLVVAPATLVATWTAEAARFAPDLRVFAAHASQTSPATLLCPAALLTDADVVITSYGALLRYDWLLTETWDVVALDEAQAIKNPGAVQTRAAKALRARQRLALTGTPVENRPLDLWSLFDFFAPGLLGTAAQFGAFLKPPDAAAPEAALAALRTLVRPFILRRLKSDKALLPDLPDKTEVDVACGLMPAQAAVYERVVAELRRELAAVGGIQRKGLVLAALLKLKQVCDHPALALGYGEFAPEASGKLRRLAEIAEELAARQEKLLVFTQFRAMTGVLDRELARLFGRAGCVLHGDTPVQNRRALVERFQAPDGPPYFVLSLKAGGTGLTLTAASHVVHFDRWWNPAVEDQATDRAYRIGQRRPVVVHKFTCAGTVEANIADLIAAKRGVAGELLAGGEGALLTELSDRELLALVALDITKASCEP